MNLIEKFKISSNGWKTAFADFGGEDVGMKIEDTILYTFLPFGELLLRINKLNGSLDKMYFFIICLITNGFLINSIFSIYEYNYKTQIFIWFIINSLFQLPTALLAYFKKMHKVDESQGNVIDLFVLIPLIARFILGFGTVYINVYLGQTWGPVASNVLLFLTIMFTQFIRLAVRRQCSDKHWNNYSWERFVKIFFDALFIFGIIFMLTSGVLGIQNISQNYKNLFNRPVQYFGNMKNLIVMIAWLGGFLLGYGINNMIDITFNTSFEPPYDNDGVCTGNVSDLRYVIAIIVFLVGAIMYSKYSSYDFIGNMDQGSFGFSQNINQQAPIVDASTNISNESVV